MTSTSETLNLAADLIQQRGWTFGDGWPFHNQPSSSLCLEGGIMAAVGMTVGDPLDVHGTVLRDVEHCPAYVAVRNYLDLDGLTRLYRWNDKRDRTESEVIEVLRAAAAIEQAREDQDAAWSTYAAQVTA